MFKYFYDIKILYISKPIYHICIETINLRTQSVTLNFKTINHQKSLYIEISIYQNNKRLYF